MLYKTIEEHLAPGEFGVLLAQAPLVILQGGYVIVNTYNAQGFIGLVAHQGVGYGDR